METTAGIDCNVTDKENVNKTWGTANRINNSTNGLNIILKAVRTGPSTAL